jgi:hypothetical protein
MTSNAHGQSAGDASHFTTSRPLKDIAEIQLWSYAEELAARAVRSQFIQVRR